MMKFLRFTSETAARAAFAEHLTENGEWPAYIDTVAVDVIGTIYQTTGRMLQTPDGEVPQMAAVFGFHINLSAYVSDLEAFEIDNPSTPNRIFFGMDVSF